MPEYKVYYKIGRYGFFWCLGCTFLGTVFIIINLIKNYSAESLALTIGFPLFLCLGTTFVFLCGYVYGITAYEDHFVFTALFGKKRKFKYDEVFVSKRFAYLDIVTADGEIIARLLLIARAAVMENAYLFVSRFSDDNAVPYKDEGIVRFCGRIKGGGIAFIVTGAIALAFAVAFALFPEMVEGDDVPKFIIFFVCLGSPIVLAGVVCLLHYYIWKVVVGSNEICFVNFLGIKKMLPKESVSVKLSASCNRVLINKDGKKFKTINAHILKNSDILLDLKCFK